MKTFVSALLLLGMLVGSGGSRVRAADRPTPLRKGKVLILKNEYTIEGDIERVGDRYCIRRKGGITWVPAERALTLTASLPDAYAYLRGRINLDDPDERLRLARWCQNNGLRQQALAELQAAAQLRPAHAETRRLLRYWQQAAASGVASAPREKHTGGADAPPLANDPPPIEVTSESLGMFATRVQPILMNTCARCHATGHGGKFHLTQVYRDSISSRRTLERNLAAVLSEIDVNQPELSPLLIKAVSDHAHIGQAPLRNRQAAPYCTLESWVKRTVADNPQLRDKSVAKRAGSVSDGSAPVANASGSSSPFEEPRAKAGEESEWGAEARPPAVPPPSPVARGDNIPTPSSPKLGAGGVGVSPPPTPVDPYDPEPFNRKMHPEANK